ncbi:MAG: HDIG domain-containing protein [Deferrisomatales bacterium]
MPHPSRSSRSDRKSPGGDTKSREGDEGAFGSSWRRVLAPVAWAALMAVPIALFVGTPIRLSSPVYRAGDVAREDVKARQDFLVPDPEATERKRREAERASPAVYDRNPNALADALAGLREDLKGVDGDPVGPDGPLPPDARAIARALEQRWEIPVDPGLARELVRPGRKDALVVEVRRALEPLYDRGVVANRRLLLAEGPRGVVVRDVAGKQEGPLDNPASVADFDEARKELLGASGPDAFSTLAGRVAGALLRPNLTYNSEETSARRAASREAVKPVLYQIRRGEMLVREGDRVTPEQARKLAAHAAMAQNRHAWESHAGLVALGFLCLYLTYLFGAGNVKKFRQEPRDLVFLSALLLTMLLIQRGGLLLSVALSEVIRGVGPAYLAYGLPVAAAAIAARVILNSETAVLFSVPYTVLASLAFENSLAAFLCFFFGGLVGAHRSARACLRMDFLRAGCWAGLAQGAVVGGLALLQTGAPGPEELGWAAAAVSVGLLSGVLVLCLVPVAEWAFGYTTETRLTELASLDHPLLRELMLRAPGTYHHSIVTGSLVKAAAEAIGARVLLATVAAYYHDIGKISKPAYFIENQGDGQNRHDKLAPSMSSLILLSHVKEGVELARKYRLGADLVDIVGQHHGTSLIRFFYDKACQTARDGVEAVSESDYRYPGPKPQTREAALVLLADTVEAACRTVADPRPARIRGVVQNIVNRTFTDGQLDECDLTLSDLHEIARAFSRILCGIHHQRIDYPLAAHKERMPDGDLDPKRLRRNGRGGRDHAPKPGAEDLKRLGL